MNQLEKIKEEYCKEENCMQHELLFDDIEPLMQRAFNAALELAAERGENLHEYQKESILSLKLNS